MKSNQIRVKYKILYMEMDEFSIKFDEIIVEECYLWLDVRIFHDTDGVCNLYYYKYYWICNYLYLM